MISYSDPNQNKINSQEEDKNTEENEENDDV